MRRCIKEHIKIDVIVAASHKNIKTTKRVLNFHKYNITLDHPRDVASQFRIPYFNCNHNSLELKRIINEFEINFGIIAGARILNKDIIAKFSYGVLNIHPGLLPKNRGLDSILWAIHENKKIGVSAHLINDKIDEGLLVLKEVIEVFQTDSIFDIYRKVHKTQINVLLKAYNIIGDKMNFSVLNGGSYYTYMPEEIQKKTLKNLKSYIANYSKIK